MKILAVHDFQGNIARFVIGPSTGPAGLIRARPDQLVTEISPPDIAVDPARPETYEQFAELIKSFRVQVKTEGRLIPKSATKTE